MGVALMGRRLRDDVSGEVLTADQERELLCGPDLADLFRDDPDGLVFEDAAHRKRAWERHRERLIAAAAEREAGRRPWAYWEIEVKRPELNAPDSILDPERVRVLVERGDLPEHEAAALRAAADEAAERVGTDAERYGELRVPESCLDQIAVAVGEAISQPRRRAQRGGPA